MATYTVTFSEPVASAGVGIGIGDLVATVVTGSFSTAPTVASGTVVIGGGQSTSFTVVVGAGTEEGTIRLEVPPIATVIDTAVNTNDNPTGFTTGDAVQIDTPFVPDLVVASGSGV